MKDDRASLRPSQMPDYLAWQKANAGAEFSTTDYLVGVFGAARLHPDFLVALTELLWPRFVEVEGAVFHAAYFSAARHEELLAGCSTTREREYWMNLVILDRLFETPDDGFLAQHAAVLLSTVSGMWRARLSEVFPDRQFDITTIEDHEAGDYGLTFTQATRSPA